MEHNLSIEPNYSTRGSVHLPKLTRFLNILKESYFFMKLKRLSIKTLSWEYWPMWLVYLPSSFYYIFLAFKARSLFFFSASNPSIENGGMFFESKWNIFQLIPQEYYPSTIFIKEGESIDIILKKIDVAEINFPMIAKPDVGGRGFGVKKLYSLSDLKEYIKNVKVSFLIQAFVKKPFECSVFYYRKPGNLKGEIISFTQKELLSVCGDGRSTLKELIFSNNRAFLQYDAIKKNSRINLNQILMNREETMLVPYGNHVLGAKFINAQHLVDEALLNTFDTISKQIDGFYFGRYDLLCTSLSDLKKGKNISILELNGAGAEPAHIYDPEFSYFKAQAVLASYFKKMYEASNANHKIGLPYMTFFEFMKARQLEKDYKNKITLS